MATVCVRFVRLHQQRRHDHHLRGNVRIAQVTVTVHVTANLTKWRQGAMSPLLQNAATVGRIVGCVWGGQETDADLLHTNTYTSMSARTNSSNNNNTHSSSKSVRARTNSHAMRRHEHTPVFIDFRHRLFLWDDAHAYTHTLQTTHACPFRTCAHAHPNRLAGEQLTMNVCRPMRGKPNKPRRTGPVHVCACEQANRIGVK